MRASERPARIEWIDYARFIAALSVMSYHYFVNGIRNGKLTGLPPFDGISHVAQYGYLGVDFFFMISGFVIMASAGSGSWVHFAVSRLFRLWPAFVVCMTLTAVVLTLWPSPLMPVSGWQWLANLTMVPTAFSVPPVDGVYWTLKLELMFYTGVLAILAFRQIGRVEVIVDAWIALQSLSWLTASGYWFLEGYDPFFAAGCLFYFVRRDGVSVYRLISLAVCLFLAINASQVTVDSLNQAYSSTVSLVAVAMIVSGFFIVFTAMGIAAPKLPGSKVIGSLTYPMYLLHAHIGYTVMSRYGSADHPLVTVMVMAGLVTLVSYFVAAFIEKPAQRLRPAVELWLRSVRPTYGPAE